MATGSLVTPNSGWSELATFAETLAYQSGLNKREKIKAAAVREAAAAPSPAASVVSPSLPGVTASAGSYLPLLLIALVVGGFFFLRGK